MRVITAIEKNDRKENDICVFLAEGIAKMINVNNIYSAVGRGSSKSLGSLVRFVFVHEPDDEKFCDILERAGIERDKAYKCLTYLKSFESLTLLREQNKNDFTDFQCTIYAPKG